VKIAYFGTPELKENEYWVQANWAAFAVDGNGNCVRVTGADVDPENGSEFAMAELEQMAMDHGQARERHRVKSGIYGNQEST